MTVLTRAEVVLEGDNKDLFVSLKSAEGQMRRTGSAMDSVSRRMRTGLLAVSAVAGTVAVALGAIGVKLGKSAVEAGSFLEDARLSLDALLGSTEAGAEAMEKLNNLAGRVPQTFKELISASGSLGAAADGSADDLVRMVEIAADIQSTFPQLRLEEVAANLQRAFSGGIASAELFRERGVTAMLGFQSGVSVSADETKRRIMAMWDDSTNSMVGATGRMAKNWTGIVSMLEDTWFRFTTKIAESGVFDAMKGGVTDIQEALNRLNESGALDRFANAFGSVVAPAIAGVSDKLSDMLNWLDKNQQGVANLAVAMAASARIMVASVALVGKALKNQVELIGATGAALAAIANRDMPALGAAVFRANKEMKDMETAADEFGKTLNSAIFDVLEQVSGGAMRRALTGAVQAAEDAAGAGGGGGGRRTGGDGGKLVARDLSPVRRGIFPDTLERMPITIDRIGVSPRAEEELVDRLEKIFSVSGLGELIGEDLAKSIGKGLTIEGARGRLANVEEWMNLDSIEMQLRSAGVSLGRSFMQGIITGTLNMKQFLLNTMAMVADIFIKKELEALLGVASPSKVMASIGRDVTRGLARGILAETASIDTAMNDLAGRVASPGRVASDTGGAAAPVTLNQEIHTMGRENIRDVVRGEVFRALRDANALGQR